MVATVSETVSMPMTTPMPCFDDIIDSDYCTVGTLSAGGFVVLILVFCLLHGSPTSMCLCEEEEEEEEEREDGGWHG